MNTSRSKERILGIIASSRKLGNSELLVKKALASARDHGAEVEMLRLSDFSFHSCKGCLRCIFFSQDCPVKDDIPFFFSKISRAEGIIVGSPTYIMFPPGVIKLIIDRGGIFFSKRDQIPHQKGGIISVAGLKGWDHFTIPMLSMFLYTMNPGNMEIVDCFSAYSPGPGQVLLDEENTLNAACLGTNVLRAIRGERIHAHQEKNQCPVCRSSFFCLNGNSVFCPICLAEGKRTEEEIIWDEKSVQKHRYTTQSAKEFVDQWIRCTKVVYEKNSRQILELREKSRNKNVQIEWCRKKEGEE